MARAQKRVGRKEIRQDPLMKVVVKGRGWMDVHGNKAMIGVIALVVAIIAVIVVRNMRFSANDEAQVSLAQARQMLMENRETDALALFEETSTRFKGTQGGANALFSLAELKLADGENEEALEIFKRFEKKYGSEFMLNFGAMSGQAVALENLQRFDEAAVVFEKIASKDKYGHLQPYALYEAGRCWIRAGDETKAQGYFDRVVKEYPDSPEKRDAERELALLNIKL
ncbi:MAG: tetratricopeptide repeat protein [Candidatus Electryonea clarkiae]|nr:tetratricopeptide repeat protein [Candidatus Electryonea clarkiae]MDP8286600.1 tetratricopeptide repeat protein [Candidatus Electryonea clarkiae]